MKARFIIRLLGILLFLSPGIAGYVIAGEDAPHQVLFLNSYNPGMVFSDEELRGVKTSLAPLGDDLELRVEYMDTKKISDPEHFENLKTLYSHKYRNAGIDLIIAADNSAFDFMLDSRDEIFPGVPVVFSGLNYFSEDMIEGFANITGVVEDKDIRSTLELAFQQFPDTRHIVVIHDTTSTGQALRKHVEQFVPEYEDRVSFQYLSNVTSSELITAVSNLPDRTVILLEAFNLDAEGTVYTHEAIGDLISAHTDRPMYGNTEMYVGHGVIGGKITTGFEQGKAAGEMALGIITGDQVSDHPVIENSHNVFMFDYNKLRQFGIPEESLPEESIIINKPPALQVPLWVLAFAAVVIGSLVAIIVVLSYYIQIKQKREQELRQSIADRERSRAELKTVNDELNQTYQDLQQREQKIVESERKFRAIFHQTFEQISILDREGIIQQLNETALSMIGDDEKELIGRPFWEMPWSLEGEERQTLVHDAILRASEGELVRFEIAYNSPKEGIRYLDFSIKPVHDEKGTVTMLIPEGRDITDRRMTNLALEQALKKLNVLNSLTFNDIRNDIYALQGYIHLQTMESDPESISLVADSEMTILKNINNSLDFAKTYQDLGLKKPIWHNVMQTYLFAASHLDVMNFSREIEVEGLEIFADPLLENVFISLIENTIVHGKGADTIYLTYEEDPSGLKLIYQDNGNGIPEDEKELIFQRGYGEYKGLGLFLAREILGITAISITETGQHLTGARFEMHIQKGRFRFVPRNS